MDFFGKTFALIGVSGSGKGTQAKLLIEDLKKVGQKVLYIYTGDLFRELSQKQSLAAEKVRTDLESGVLPEEWIASFLWQRKLIEELRDKKEVILFDGSPRRMRESEDMDKVLKWFHRDPFHLIYLELSRESAFKRLKLRAREDDTDENINKRLNWFYENVEPIVEHFEKEMPERLIKIDGEKSIEDVYQEIKEKLSEIES